MHLSRLFTDSTVREQVSPSPSLQTLESSLQQKTEREAMEAAALGLLLFFPKEEPPDMFVSIGSL